MRGTLPVERKHLKWEKLGGYAVSKRYQEAVPFAIEKGRAYYSWKRGQSFSSIFPDFEVDTKFPYMASLYGKYIGVTIDMTA